MLKKIVSAIAFLCGTLSMMSCSDILDKEPKESLLYENALKDEKSLQYALNGVYNKLQSTNYYGRNLYVIEELLSDNAKISPNNSDKFTAFYNHSFTTSEPEILGLWSSCYAVIWQSNEILSALEQMDSTQTSLKQIHAEALSLRALAYYDLLRLFAMPYKIKTYVDGADGKGGHLGVPLVTQAISIDSISNMPRATVKEVYQQIVNDLKTSIDLYCTSGEPYNFCKEAAQALLARVYFYAGNESAAFNTAIDVYTSGKYSLMTGDEYVESWAKGYTSESIFSIAFSKTDNNGTDALGYLYSKKGYNDVYPTNDFLSLYSTNDIRTQLYDETEIKKYPEIDGQIGYNNIPVIRFSEICLIIAEVAAKYEDYKHICVEILNAIATRADNTMVPYNESDDLLTAVRLERRKELAFEGVRFSDLMRLQSDIVREDCSAAKSEISFPSKTCELPIPQHEMNANSNMIQNKDF